MRFGTEKDYALLDELEKKLKENPDDVDLLIQKGVLYLDAAEDDDLAFPPPSVQTSPLFKGLFKQKIRRDYYTEKAPDQDLQR
ncbi:hypothetical protein ACFLY6_02840 [Candidatus Dependentiae bacterium]